MTTMTAAEARLVARAVGVLEKLMKYGERDALNSPAQVREMLRLRFAGMGHEEFHVLYLDSQNKLIEAEAMFRGTLTQAAVYPREIAKGALLKNAAAVILAHNHPSGAAEPSAADRVLTNAVKNALALLDVTVLDHLIVTTERCFSFAEAGLI